MDFITDQKEVKQYLLCDYKKNSTFNSLWEIQKINPFIGFESNKDDYFRFKNLATGLFLAEHKCDLILINDGSYNECCFKLDPRKKSKKNGIISY